MIYCKLTIGSINTAIAQDTNFQFLQHIFENMLFSSVFLFSSLILSAIAAPTPMGSIEKRQGDIQILQTIAPNYLVLLDQSQPDTIYGSQ